MRRREGLDDGLVLVGLEALDDDLLDEHLARRPLARVIVSLVFAIALRLCAMKKKCGERNNKSSKLLHGEGRATRRT